MREEIVNELGKEITNGKGCIVLDFSCYFPYANQDCLEFKFKLGEDELEPYKYNHRYPNRDYVTISKKMGRRVSRIGYPVFVDLNDEYFFILEIEVGIKDYKTVQLGFPVIIKLTEEKPVCNLGFRFNFDAATFQFESYYEHENDGMIGHRHTIWTNKEEHNIENAIVITPLIQDYSKNGVYVAEVLTPHPQTFEHFMC